MSANLRVKLNEYSLLDYEFNHDGFLEVRFNLLTPTFKFFQYEEDVWVEWYREVGVRAPTTFIFNKSEHFWSFTATLLGFGISFAYQNGY